jgi:hypothetical protein
VDYQDLEYIREDRFCLFPADRFVEILLIHQMVMMGEGQRPAMADHPKKRLTSLLHSIGHPDGVYSSFI